MPVTLPSDALEQIVAYVDEYSDVLNVALSNKALYEAAVPLHLQYRDIRSRLNNPVLWTWLSRLDDLRAARIRSLTLLADDEFGWEMHERTHDLSERMPSEFEKSGRERLPELTPELTPEACRECEVVLVKALKRMSRLQRFRWYRVPRPVLEGPDDIWSTLAQLGTVREIDVLDKEASTFDVAPIALSETFLRLSALTTFKLRTSVCSLKDDPEISQLEQMLLQNCPDIEVLVLDLDLSEPVITPNIDRLLGDAHWSSLRVLRLGGVNCRAPEVARFLIAHPRLEELALAQMMPGHAWTRLELPEDALPNLRHLECSSAQAAALLKKASKWPLETLLGVEVHETIIDSEYFSWDDDWEEEDHKDEESGPIPSPWRTLFLERLKAQKSITCLGVVCISAPEEMKTLAAVAPQLKHLRIKPDPDHNRIPEAEWYRLYSLFPALEVIDDGCLISFDPHASAEATATYNEKVNTHIQALARGCPRLRLVQAGPDGKKVLIIRDGQSDASVRWVARRWKGSEDQEVKDGEGEYVP
ncbi:hypothetical protein NLJ89_g9537 [Agrocybe chaxingu]|uniref:Uncharacterized protein n=1 Tax=Agrocybe chaxingu TaxID=84603 RepID=A0A9W8MPS1_9AGAR|nr:hypothetical protein NLJ89_g9537 [Agrocybe chaxingu]